MDEERKDVYETLETLIAKIDDLIKTITDKKATKEETQETSKEIETETSKEIETETSKEIETETSKEIETETSKEIETETSKEIKVLEVLTVKIDDLIKMINDKKGTCEDKIKENPLAYVLGAFSGGLVTGFLIGKGKEGKK